MQELLSSSFQLDSPISGLSSKSKTHLAASFNLTISGVSSVLSFSVVIIVLSACFKWVCRWNIWRECLLSPAKLPHLRMIQTSANCPHTLAG